MAREGLRRNASSPSPLSSPTPSSVAAFTVRKDAVSSFAPSAPFRDVSSPLSASHASLTTDPVHATLSPRPMHPSAYQVDLADAHNAAKAALSPKLPRVEAHLVSNPSQPTKTTRPSAGATRAASVLSAPSIRSDKAAERAFYRRILFQNLPSTEHAPSITHDSDLDHEIYLLLAYLLRETVLPWYSKLTPDREFLTQITSIIASIIHTVVERQTADGGVATSSAIGSGIDSPASSPSTAAELPRVHAFISRDIPLILRQHFLDFRQAQTKADSILTPLGTHSFSSVASTVLSQLDNDERRRQQVREQGPLFYQEALDAEPSGTGSLSPLQVALQFQAASPHPGLDSTTGSLDGKIDLAYLRIAVINLLSSLLPADEFAPDTEKFIIRDVLVTVLRGALARSSRPWFFVQSLHKVLDAAGWPTDPLLPPTESDDDMQDQMDVTNSTSAAGDGAGAAILGLVTRLPAMLLQAWSFVMFTALPFLVRAYFDLFNVHRARKRRALHPALQDDAGSLRRSSSVKGGMSSSLSTGSLFERKMHGRYPSRKFHLGDDGTLTDQGRSTAIDTKPGMIHAESAQASQVDNEANGHEGVVEVDHPPDYAGNWLDTAEEALSANTHAVLRALFGLVRVVLATSGLEGSVNRMLTRRINAELRDTQKLTRMVRELRRILLPNGHLPSSVPDPDVETQEAEWIRLRTRLVCATSKQERFVPRLVKSVLLGSAEGGFVREDPSAGSKDTQIQLQRLTTWLEPLCSPQAAGPNTLLAILLFERVVVAICPDLTLS
ncbi:PXA domain-containing protein [Pseudozyma hubeiensis]|nr:PXA domain-containing protein [Pseudozyma hubeiensis]